MSDIYARRRPVSHAERDAASAAWARLKRENAPLRVVHKGQLVSVPVTHFDAVLVGQTTPVWELVIKLIARTLNHLNNKIDLPGQGITHEFLFARLLALGKARAVEIKGAGPGMRDYDVRLPSAASKV